MDLPVRIPGRQRAASGSLCFPVTKGNYEFIITLHPEEKGGQKTPLCPYASGSRCEKLRVQAGPGSCLPAPRHSCLHPGTLCTPLSWTTEVSPLLCTGHICSCPGEVHGEGASILVDEGFREASLRGVLCPLCPHPPLSWSQILPDNCLGALPTRHLYTDRSSNLSHAISWGERECFVSFSFLKATQQTASHRAKFCQSHAFPRTGYVSLSLQKTVPFGQMCLKEIVK